MRKTTKKRILIVKGVYLVTYIVAVPQINMAFKEKLCGTGFGLEFSYLGLKSTALALVSGNTQYFFSTESFALVPLITFNSGAWYDCGHKQVSLWLFGFVIPLYSEYWLDD